MTDNQKEALWWILGVILWIVLIILTFAMATPASAQSAPKPPDFVGRSLNKTIVVGPYGNRSVYPAPADSGVNFVRAPNEFKYRDPAGKWHTLKPQRISPPVIHDYPRPRQDHRRK